MLNSEKIKKKMFRMKKKTIYIVTAKSESGDHYGLKRYDKKPKEKDLRNFIKSTGEELDCGGPGDFGSYVHIKVDKV